MNPTRKELDGALKSSAVTVRAVIECDPAASLIEKPKKKEPVHRPRFFAFSTVIRDEISACPVEFDTPRVRHVGPPLEKGELAGKETATML